MTISFDDQYKQALSTILTQPPSYTGRLNASVRRIPGLTMRFNVKSNFPFLMLRPISALVVAAEALWNISGDRSLAMMHAAGVHIWDPWSIDNSVVVNAYGYRWRRCFDRDQLMLAMSLVNSDPGTRHAVVWAWDPARDGLNPEYPMQNVPCISGFQLLARVGQLDMVVTVRSQDMIAGFPHDVAVYAVILHLLAKAMHYQPGELIWNIADAHIYGKNIADAETMLTRPACSGVYYNMPIEPEAARAIINKPTVEDIGWLANSLYWKSPFPRIKVDVV